MIRRPPLPLFAAAALLFATSAVAVAVAAPAPQPAAAPPAGDTTTLVLVATTDQHGHAEPVREELALDGGARVKVDRGGAALFGGYLDILRKKHPGHVLLVDGGDMMQGTLLSNVGEGAVMMRVMNALGYAAAAVGNHEFDYGPVGPHAVAVEPGEDPLGVIKARAAESKFPWLTSNIVDGAGRPPGAPAVRAFTVVTVGGVKVGIVGGTSEDTPRTTIKPNLVGLTVKPLAPSVTEAARAARSAGATVVIAVVHEGGECTRFVDPTDLAACHRDAPLFQLARSLADAHAGVDAIFGGHSHQGVAAVVAGIPVAQAFADGRAFARIDLTVDKKSGRAVPGGFHVYPPEEVCAEVTDGVRSCSARRARGKALVAATYEGEPVRPDARVAKVMAPDVERAAARRSERVGVRLETPIKRAYKAESSLGNLVADLLRAATGADVGMTNGGGLRADLPAGDLTYGVLYEALPFENRLATVRMTGAHLRRLIASNVASDKGVLSVSGLRVAARCEGGRPTVTLTLADGRPVDDRARYVVGTTDFLALGGDDFPSVLKELAATEVAIDDRAPTLRDVVADALRRRGGVLRGEDPALFDAAHPRLALPTARPVRCSP